MANEFRLILEACDIVWYPPSPEPPEMALPDQLVEILPRPESTAGQADELWAPWYFAKVYADDGVRFTQGVVEKRYTKPLPEPIDKDDFTLQCVSAAAAAGVRAADLLATADYLSGIQNIVPRNSSAAGPFLFTEKSWAITIVDAPDLGFSPADRLWPYRQPHAAAAEAADTKERFRAASLPEPTAVEHVFVRLFGRESAGLLTQVGKPGFQDISIEEVIANYCSGELQGSVAKDVLINEISAAYPDLLGPPTARRNVSQVHQALRTALQAPLQRAGTLVRPLQQEPPTEEPVSPDSASSLKLGVNDEFRDEILAAAEKCGMDPAGLAALIDAEAAKLPSGLWDRKCTNPKSTAYGLTQFLKGSWTHMASMPWTTLNQAAKAQGCVDANNRVTNADKLLGLRSDPLLSIMSAAEYAASNLKFVMNKNPRYPSLYDPSTPDGKMRLAYLCHHEGPGGALTYLRGGKANSYVEWLDSYIDRKIVPSRFRSASPTRGTGTGSSGGTGGAGKLGGGGTGGAGKPGGGGTGGVSSGGTGKGAIPTNVATVPAASPIDFAGLGASENQWHWPLVTSDRRAMIVSYRTTSNTVEGKPSREFLANRQGGARYHVGMDIFCHQGDIVLAVADGEIVAFYPFYEGTNALLIEHDGVVINYGEVAPNVGEFGWRKNGPVKAGQEIARVGRLNMIHFETYKPGTVANARWMKGGARPLSLRNPTKLLLGLAVRGIRGQ